MSVTDPSRVAFGLGFGADVQLLDQGTANPDGSMSKPVIATDIGTPTDRAAVQAKSFLHLVPNGDGTFGLQSETHETFAPITLFKNTANELRIELLGEWVLRATATGKLGGASITYAPAAPGFTDGDRIPTTALRAPDGAPGLLARYYNATTTPPRFFLPGAFYFCSFTCLRTQEASTLNKPGTCRFSEDISALPPV